MISKACIVGAYQKKLEEIARYDDVELTVVVPPAWIDERGIARLEKVYTQGYKLRVEPMALNGHFHLHYYPTLARVMREEKPDIVHIDEEPYNLATYLAMRQAIKVQAHTVVFTWQNIKRNYPPPFSLMEQNVLEHTEILIAGNEESVRVWRAKGFRGEIVVIPQFGVDPNIYYRHESITRSSKPSLVLRRSARRPSQPKLVIGYVGRLVPQKGVALLLRAASRIKGPWEIRVLGGGPDRARLERLSQWLGISPRVKFDEQLPSTHLPNYFSNLDVLVLPSITRPNWKEQFGRVLIEAMACGVITIGADSGAIPEVIGDAGLVFKEADEEDLREKLEILITKPDLRVILQQKGLERVEAHFTQAIIAERTVAVYRRLCEAKERSPIEQEQTIG
jgi:glycosyltransferase involved in cell wall biosynthesis